MSEQAGAASKIVVQKYGGSSVADVERLQRVARRVVDTVESGYRVAVVISAMGKTTDQLLSLAKEVCANPPRREVDMLVTAGERIASSLLAMAIHELGHEAVSFTGSQCGIITSHRHNNARILEVRPYRVQDELDAGRIVIIAGYQGVSYKREVTTLGRGGTDTTAVAMAAALGAEYCEICSDVDGVYTADPRVVGEPRHLEAVSYDEMQELALHGAKVLNAQAVEFARRHRILIVARATSGSDKATRIASPADTEGAGAVGVTATRGLWRFRGKGGAEQLAALSRILEESQTAPLFTRLEGAQPMVVVDITNCHHVEVLEQRICEAGELEITRDLATASVVGLGVGDDPAHLKTLFAAAEDASAEVLGVDSAPLRLTVLTRPERLDELQRALHARFVEAQRQS
ncbi:MAG: aspartate kinase [Deltaproteobacteria bacterium]|nr:MAG: aspartate kinase [Pseudomonadota bacterium]PIE66264.1 MAG: aspartate kinase [Deltaproteobacteria bacterium]